MSSAQQKHSKSQTRALLSTVKIIWKTTKGWPAPHRSMGNSITGRDERVKKNRWMSCQFIDAVCSLANQKFPFCCHVESSTSLNKVNFAEFRALLKNHGPLLANHLNSATVI